MSDSDEGKKRSDEGKKSSINLPLIIITSLVGFFFGTGSNQITDYAKRADDCAEALTQLASGLAQIPSFLPTVISTEAEVDQRTAALVQLNHIVSTPHVEMVIRCPSKGGEYLKQADIDTINHTWDVVGMDCMLHKTCSYEAGDTAAEEGQMAIKRMISDAKQVSEWGIIRRSLYAVEHVY